VRTRTYDFPQPRRSAVSPRLDTAIRRLLAGDPDLLAEVIEKDGETRRRFESARPQLRGNQRARSPRP
jgi:hypothetical protein